MSRKMDEAKTCSVCGTALSGVDESCPVCMLRKGLTGGIESGESSSESRLEATSQDAEDRFEHYQLVKGEDGKPVELGRGAMGITYKAFDVDLRCPVALKVISERYLGDESARLRFLREARAAARLRHSNVASVLHLGRTGSSYFYAMEFVEGETLESLIKRSGRIEVKLALEIATQVASGLAAVHKQKLVHRDIKPSNIMVNLEEGGAVTAKIIDLGLAKSLDEPGSQTAISTPGAFAGTPEFASPEQFAGVPVDIRSDLYSLGVTLWEMVTGKTPFQGTPCEVMHQHQRAPLPLDLLEDVPQPVVVLLEVLLEKDLGRRFQNPAELLEAIPTIAGAIDARRRITRQSLQKTPSTASRVGTRRPQAIPGPEKISVARLPITGSEVFGREQDIAFLDRAWAKKDVNVVTIVAWAGVGKSTLVNHWLRRMAAKRYRSAELVFGWSFYRQGTSGGSSSADEFLDAALSWFGDPDPRLGTAWEKGERLAKLVAHGRTLLILDGLEPLQNPPGPQEGRIREPGLQALLRELAAFNTGLCVITTRLPIADIADQERTSALRRELEHLSCDAGAKLLRALGVMGHEAELRAASDEFTGHCLALTLLGSYLNDAYDGDVCCRKEVSERLAHDVRQGVHARKVMESYQTWFGDGPELSALRMLGLFDRPADEKAVGALLKPPAIAELTESLTNLSPTEWRTIISRLRRARLLAAEDPDNPGHLDAHPLVREYFGEQLQSQRTDAWKECNRRLYDYYRTLAPQLPDNFREMEPLFLAVICGCHAGLFREALHEVYIPRIMRNRTMFAATVLGAYESLLSILAFLFSDQQFTQPILEPPEDKLYLLNQVAICITALRGYASRQLEVIYQHGEHWAYKTDNAELTFPIKYGLWRFRVASGQVRQSLEIAKELTRLAARITDPTYLTAAHRILATTYFCLGEFQKCHAYATLEVDKAGSTSYRLGDLNDDPVVICFCLKAISLWNLGFPTQAQIFQQRALEMARSQRNPYCLSIALYLGCYVSDLRKDLQDTDRISKQLKSVCEEYGIGWWLASAEIRIAWVSGILGRPEAAIERIEVGIQAWHRTGAGIALPYWRTLQAELCLRAGWFNRALDALEEAERQLARTQECWYRPEIFRLKAEALFCLGNIDKANACLEQGMAITNEMGMLGFKLRSATTAVKLHRDGEKCMAAMVQLESIVSQFEEGWETYDLVEARRVLRELSRDANDASQKRGIQGE
jgi:serine/threonine protein kinase/tetratricopeptide (TPR) repeat protein